MARVFRAKNTCICLFCLLLLSHSFYVSAGDIADVHLKNNVNINQKIDKYFSNKTYSLNIFLYTDTFDSFENNYPLLVKLLSGIQANTVYLAFNNKRFSTSKTYSTNIKSFIKLAHNNKIKVSALIYNDIYPYFNKSYRNNVIKNLKKYLSECAANEKFDSITSDLEPNTIRKNIKNIPPSFKLRWDRKNGWGKNGANNKLLSLTISLLQELKKHFPETFISQTTQFYFNSYVNKGLLTVGNSNDFLKVCDNVIIMCYFNNLSDITKFSRKNLKETTKANSLIICVKTTDKGNPGTTLGGKDVISLTKILTNIAKKSSKFSSFGGLAIYDLKGLIQILSK